MLTYQCLHRSLNRKLSFRSVQNGAGCIIRTRGFLGLVLKLAKAVKLNDRASDHPAILGLNPRPLTSMTSVFYWQVDTLKFAILVFHLIELPVWFEAKYSFTYQKVQSSTGSTVIDV